MSVTIGSIWRPQAGRGSTVRVASVVGSTALVQPWPQRGRAKLAQRRVQLTADGASLVGYTATGQHG